MMTRGRTYFILCAIILAVLLSACTGTIETTDTSDNPIDDAFRRDFEAVSNTMEMNYVSGVYLEAWKAEWDHLMAELMKHYEFAGDQNTIKEYKRSYEAFVEQASGLEWIDWSDTSVPPGKDRSFGSGAISASSAEEANLYKRQVLYLIEKHFVDGSEYGKYTYLYNGNGAELDSVIEQ